MGSMPQATKRRVLVIGSGGVGTMAAYALEKGGKATVTAVLRSNYDAVQRSGFTISSLDHGEIQGWRPIRNSIPDVSQGRLKPYDFVVVTTKNIADVPPGVADMIAPAITPGHTAITLLQNGLNIERPIVAAFPSSPVLSGISFIGATEGPLGTIKHDNHDELSVGAFLSSSSSYSYCNGGTDKTDVAKAEAAARLFVDMYSSCPGVDCAYEPDVAFSRWRKLLYNASFNSVAAILRMDTSRMRISEHVIDNLIRPIMLEIIKVAGAAGTPLPSELVDKFIVIDNFEAFFKPSMFQDIESGGFIEFENIVGEPLREAERLGVETPTLRVVYGLLKGLQWQTMEKKGLVKVPVASEPGLKYGGSK
ncbi:putative 2-dehydropantoate 2-reductase [Diplogelasinospora grovesii]|uniref:2-dehydropantoate 2-reductase n=1 Tax=Diplogelasinospora grovesii TaxID=303347 RepID=A0AAN6S0J0_9PEZI|nr:putative 2-dehydropantoate 2-reductase [Diplogelasinospora grovesii]